MKGHHKKHLHQTPSEFAEAAEVRAFRESHKTHADEWREWEHEQRREKIRNMQMPAHKPPSRKVVGRAMATERLYESETAYRKRLAKWYKRYGKNNHTSST